MLCTEKGARLRVAPVDDRGQIILEEYEKLLGPKTRLVSFTQVSNALGTITPAKQMIEMAHRHGARVLVDGAQAVSHMRVDVQALDCDFYVFSGHKVFAPTGIGAVYSPSALLDAMPPWQGGGNMIQDVTFERTIYQPAPARFEAGTGNIADAVGLGAALDWLSRVGIEKVERHEHELLVYGTERLATVPGLTMIGTARGEGRRPLVRPRRSEDRRGRRHARQGGHRGALRSSLRAADPSPFRARGDRPRLARAVQHVRGHRRARRGSPSHPGGPRDASVTQIPPRPAGSVAGSVSLQTASDQLRPREADSSAGELEIAHVLFTANMKLRSLLVSGPCAARRALVSGVVTIASLSLGCTKLLDLGATKEDAATAALDAAPATGAPTSTGSASVVAADAAAPPTLAKSAAGGGRHDARARQGRQLRGWLHLGRAANRSDKLLFQDLPLRDRLSEGDSSVQTKRHSVAGP